MNWIKIDNNFSIYTFKFNWKGLINGEIAQGNGIGTTTLILENGTWKLLKELLEKE